MSVLHVHSSMFSHASSTPPPGPSRLLALPRELRDTIYEFTLTEPNGLSLRTRLSFFVGLRNNSKQEEMNQLKYVCRQLYAETKGRALQ